MKADNNNYDFNLLKDNIKIWARELGFSQLGICNADFSSEKDNYFNWLSKNFHADMQYLENHAEQRFTPQKLLPDVQTIISVSLQYSPPTNDTSHLISAYALGRDYHKIIRKRLEQLATKIKTEIKEFNYRVFCDSAPVLEKTIALKSGLGFRGKNNLLINPKAGSYFFLGEIFTNLPLPIDKPIKNYCGQCQRCITACPTKALISANQLDARKCLAYQTIENKNDIPNKFHKFLKNKIFGCDECQQVCPWNRFAKVSTDNLLQPFDHFKNLDLAKAASWDEKTFLQNTISSPIRRLGFKRWQRNVAIARNCSSNSE